MNFRSQSPQTAAACTMSWPVVEGAMRQHQTDFLKKITSKKNPCTKYDIPTIFDLIEYELDSQKFPRVSG